MTTKGLRQRLARWRPHLTKHYVLSYPLPMLGDAPEQPESFWFKVVIDADDPHLAQVEPKWRIPHARKDFAQGEWALLAIDGDRCIGKLWVAPRNRGLNPFRGPHVRVAADEDFLYGLWVHADYRRSGVGLKLAFEYGEISAVPGRNWMHGFVSEENEASKRMLSKAIPMWVSQTCTLFQMGPALSVKVPFSDQPRFGPFSRRGRHSGHGDQVPGRPADYVDHLRLVPQRAPRPCAVMPPSEGRAGPDWAAFADESETASA